MRGGRCWKVAAPLLLAALAASFGCRARASTTPATSPLSRLSVGAEVQRARAPVMDRYSRQRIHDGCDGWTEEAQRERRLVTVAGITLVAIRHHRVRSVEPSAESWSDLASDQIERCGWDEASYRCRRPERHETITSGWRLLAGEVGLELASVTSETHAQGDPPPGCEHPAAEAVDGTVLVAPGE